MLTPQGVSAKSAQSACDQNSRIESREISTRLGRDGHISGHNSIEDLEAASALVLRASAALAMLNPDHEQYRLEEIASDLYLRALEIRLREPKPY